jgi:hypothetical protein
MRSILFHHSLSTSNCPTHLHGRQSCDKLTIAGQTTQSNGLHHTHVVSLVPSPHVLTINSSSFHFMSHHLLIPSQTRLNPHNNCYSKPNSNPTQHKPNPPLAHSHHILRHQCHHLPQHTADWASTSQTHSQIISLPYFTITSTFSHINSPPSDFTPATVTTPPNTSLHIFTLQNNAHTRL